MALTAATAGWVTLAISTASAVASGIAQYQQAEGQRKLQEAQAESYRQQAEANNRQTAIEYADKMAAERVNQMQEAKKTAQQVRQAQVEMLQKQGTMIASTNASGGVINYLMDDYQRQSAQAKQSFRDQYLMTRESSNIALAAYQQKAQNQMDSQQGYTYLASDMSGNLMSAGLTTALGIGQGVIGAMNIGLSKTPNSAGTVPHGESGTK